MSDYRALSVFEAQKTDIQRQLLDGLKDKPNLTGSTSRPNGEIWVDSKWIDYTEKLEQIIIDSAAVLDNMDHDGTTCSTCKNRHLGIGAWGPCLVCLETKPDYNWVNYEKGPCDLLKQRCLTCESVEGAPETATEEGSEQPASEHGKSKERTTGRRPPFDEESAKAPPKQRDTSPPTEEPSLHTEPPGDYIDRTGGLAKHFDSLDIEPPEEPLLPSQAGNLPLDKLGRVMLPPGASSKMMYDCQSGKSLGAGWPRCPYCGGEFPVEETSGPTICPGCGKEHDPGQECPPDVPTEEPEREGRPGSQPWAGLANEPPAKESKTAVNPVTGTEYEIREAGSKGTVKGLRGKWKRDIPAEEPEKEGECWLCEGTGFVMKDRQTGTMHAKEPSIDWSKKDHNEHRCPNCGASMEGE